MISSTGDKKNKIGKEFTGITAALGGTNEWAPYGGARYVLINKENNKYQYFDLTQAKENNPTIIKYTINVSQLQCGFNNAVYMVPMTSTDNLPDYAATLYNDTQGIGFVNKDDEGMNSLEARIEIDLTECSPKAIQSTLHGYGIGKSDKSLDSERWLRDLDMNGIWKNANVDKNGNFLGNGNLKFGNSEQGDKLASGAIDTNDPIDIQVTLYSVPAEDEDIPEKGFDSGKVTGPFYTLNMEVTVSQPGKNSVILTVDSNKPNRCCKYKTYFPQKQLEKMVLLWSFWADVYENDYLTWLDGESTVRKDDFGKIRGNCGTRKESMENRINYYEAGNIQEAINKSTEPNALNFNPDDFKSNTFFTNFYNLTFKTNSITIDEDNKLKFGMALDYGYRGVNSQEKNKEDTFTIFNPVYTDYWKGRYNYSYLGCNISPNLSTSSLKKKNIFEQTSKAQPFPQIFNTICNTVFGDDNVMQMYPDDTNINCSLNDSDDSCQYLDMPLIEFSTTPSPPSSSPPGSSPPGSSPPSSSPPGSSPPGSSPPGSSPPGSSPPGSSPPGSSPPGSSPPGSSPPGSSPPGSSPPGSSPPGSSPPGSSPPGSSPPGSSPPGSSPPG
jgi:hypothetical protein